MEIRNLKNFEETRVKIIENFILFTHNTLYNIIIIYNIVTTRSDLQNLYYPPNKHAYYNDKNTNVLNINI